MQGLLSLLILLMTSFMGLKKAHADIVFVNMNGSISEIPAVQETANALGERLYVLPSTNAPGYNTKQLAQDLVRLAKLGVRPRALIISGHHVKDQGYFGTNGEVSLLQLARLLSSSGDSETSSQVQSFFAGLHSLYLWGCYTGTLNNVTLLVSPGNAPFANIQYIVGFADKAPISSNADSGRTLGQMLRLEPQLRSVSGGQLPQLIRSVSTQYDFIIHRGQSFATRDGFSQVDRFIEACQSEESNKGLLEAVLLVWKYYWNEIGPLPEDPGKGPLREAYRHLQKNNFCLQMAAVNLYQVEEIPPLSTVIRLLYYKNVVKNFSRIYASQLDYAKRELEALGLQNVGFLTQLEQTERGAAIQKLQEFHDSLKSTFPLYQSDIEQRASYLYYYRMLEDVEGVIYPSEEDVPQSWIEPNATERAWFRVLDDFTKGKENARKKALRQLQASH
ncbi:MAG: hypothetical protein ACXWRE_03625 [Pseudobdellovibrionaceae bacterium]